MRRAFFPSPRIRPRPRRGFTLIELTLVLALMALIGSVLIGGAASILRETKEGDPELVLLALLQRVREQAVKANAPIELVQLPEDRGFLWGEDGAEVLPKREGGARARIIRPEFSGAALLGGQLEERILERMRFYPDGSCDPARIEVRRGEARRVVSIDPWTAAPLPDPAAIR